MRCLEGGDNLHSFCMPSVGQLMSNDTGKAITAMKGSSKIIIRFLAVQGGRSPRSLLFVDIFL